MAVYFWHGWRKPQKLSNARSCYFPNKTHFLISWPSSLRHVHYKRYSCLFFRSISPGYNSFHPLSLRPPLSLILQLTSRTRHVERDGSHAMTAKGPHTLQVKLDSLTVYKMPEKLKWIFSGTAQVSRGEFRPRQTRQLPRAVDLKGRLLSCQSY